MMSRQRRPVVIAGLATTILLALAVTDAIAQSAPPKPKPHPFFGRVSFFSNAASTSVGGGEADGFTEMIGTMTFESRTADDSRVEYRADLRLAGYPTGPERPRRVSIYDAWMGLRFKRGQVVLRGGQMWVNELGGLGAMAGGLFEVRQAEQPKRGRWRAAIFGGLEPKIMEAGYVQDVTKAGALVAFDGVGIRRHVVGLVTVRDRGTTERTVLLTNTLLPVTRKVFIYQSAEYELGGPGAGSGLSRLTYLFTNARYAPVELVEVQGTYHRGRSVDARTIVRDQLDGRPIDPRMIDGLRFESLSGRFTLRPTRGTRLFVGYGRDRNNRDEDPSDRFSYGLSLTNILGSGFDVTASDSRMQRGEGGSYNSWYFSLGRALGTRVYLTGDIGSSLSVFRFVSSNGFVIETKPRTRRLSLSGVINLPHGMSWLGTAERVTDQDASQVRLLSGLSYRF